jgi:hypothetical protein
MASQIQAKKTSSGAGTLMTGSATNVSELIELDKYGGFGIEKNDSKAKNNA